MRKFVTKLAIVGVLILSAGTVLASDRNSANELFVKAVELVKLAEHERSIVGKLDALEEDLARLNEIVDDHPSSDLAFKLISSQDIGSISLEDVGDAALRARIMYYEGGDISENYAEQFMRVFKVLESK